MNAPSSADKPDAVAYITTCKANGAPCTFPKCQCDRTPVALKGAEFVATVPECGTLTGETPRYAEAAERASRCAGPLVQLERERIIHELCRQLERELAVTQAELDTRPLLGTPVSATRTMPCFSDDQIKKVYEDARYEAGPPDGHRHIMGLRAVAQWIEDSKTVSTRGACEPGFVPLPRELTAENGAKAALMGEFRADHDGGDYVSWDTIKRIHRRVVELFAPASAIGERK